MSEKIDLTPDKTVKSTETVSEKKSEKDSRKNLIRDIGMCAFLLVIGVGGLAAAEYVETKGPEVLYDENRVEYVIESGDTLEDLVKNLHKEIYFEKIDLSIKEKLELNNKIEEESELKGINTDDKITADITRFKNTNDHIRSDFNVIIESPKDAE